jgi:hypothetical protein
VNELAIVAQTRDMNAVEWGRYWHTLDMKKKESAKLLAKAVQQEVPSIMEAVNTDILVVDLLYHKIQITKQETGELLILPRLVIFCKDGSVYATCGEKAIRDVLFPASALGVDLPYNPSQKFRVKRVQSKSVKDHFYVSLEWQG